MCVCVCVCLCVCVRVRVCSWCQCGWVVHIVYRILQVLNILEQCGGGVEECAGDVGVELRHGPQLHDVHVAQNVTQQLHALIHVICPHP